MIRGVARRDDVYARVNGSDLLVRRYRPITRAVHALASLPCVVHVDGGGWTPSEMTRSRHLHTTLAARGSLSFVHQLRDDEVTHPSATVDAERALRWCGSTDHEFAVDPSRIAVLGTGSGAHALLTAVHSSPAVRRAMSPRAVVAAWPLLDPLLALRRAGSAGLSSMHLAAIRYFGNHRRMRRAGIAEMVLDVHVADLPALYVTRSSHVPGAPPEASDELAFAWRRTGAEAHVVEADPDDAAVVERIIADVLELPAASPAAADAPVGTESDSEAVA